MDEWKTEIRTSGGAVQDYTISYQNLDPETTYYFRVIAYNEFGISEPCTNDETVSCFSFLCLFLVCFSFLGDVYILLKHGFW